MDKTEKLTPRQLAVIDGLFAGDDEQAILDKYRVSRRLYNKWLADSNFTGEFDRRIDRAFRQSSILIARYAPLAAAKLVQLTDSKNPETARKACLDILSFLDARYNVQSSKLNVQRSPPFGVPNGTMESLRTTFNNQDSQPDSPASPLSPAAASRLLSALAEESTENQP